MHLRNWSYVAITAIAKKMAQMTPNIAYLHHSRKPGKTQKYAYSDIGYFGGSTHIDGNITKGAYYRKALSTVKPHEDLEPVEVDHPLRRLIENPNPVDTTFDLLYELDLFLELTGVAYLWLIPNAFGVPCEAWVIPSHWVWPITGGGERVLSPNRPNAEKLIEYFELRPWGGMGSSGIVRLPPEEVVMFPWKSPMNKISGYSPLTAGAQWIDTEESISKSRWAQFINQSRMDLLVTLGEGFEDPTDEDIARIESKFASKFQGEFNYGKPMIVSSGTTVTPVNFSPTEMAYFQSEDQIRDMLLSLFSVPKAVVGISQDMTFGSILATLAAFCTFCLNPRFAMLGQRLTKFLAPRFERSESEHIRIWWEIAHCDLSSAKSALT
jgi:phage portal protein BeeE